MINNNENIHKENNKKSEKLAKIFICTIVIMTILTTMLMLMRPWGKNENDMKDWEILFMIIWSVLVFVGIVSIITTGLMSIKEIYNYYKNKKITNEINKKQKICNIIHIINVLIMIAIIVSPYYMTLINMKDF